ncbi:MULTISPECIES: type III effector protein [unclassified Streptomyces]|uniref:type III effector protein n=1 Tax=unclassified Streptomyces TaxID=2593676 RepID=UPI001905C098|nr:type III effector protein [Streptomyces sp. HSG2]
MTSTDQPHPGGGAGNAPQGPVPFLAAAAALDAIGDALSSARRDPPTPAGDPTPPPERALASLLLLRRVREQLAGWETELIETAREAGASWADLAHPLGVASRQAAERRYLRGRPGPAGSTGEQRVTATRQARAAERSLAGWARVHAADLRRLAGRITGLGDLPAAAGPHLERLHAALAEDDPTALVAPLAETRPHLAAGHPGLAVELDALAPPPTGPSGPGGGRT